VLSGVEYEGYSGRRAKRSREVKVNHENSTGLLNDYGSWLIDPLMSYILGKKKQAVVYRHAMRRFESAGRNL